MAWAQEYGLLIVNVKTFKEAIKSKCFQCVGRDQTVYIKCADLVEACGRSSCGLHKVRPRVIKDTALNKLFMDILE